MQPRRRAIPDRDGTVVATGPHLAFAIGRDDEAAFSGGGVAPQHRVLRYALNGDDVKRPTRRAIAVLSGNIAVEQALLAEVAEASRRQWRSVSPRQLKRPFCQTEGGICQRRLAQGCTAALTQRCPNVRADHLAIADAQPPLPHIARDLPHGPRHLNRFRDTARPVVKIDEQGFPAFPSPAIASLSRHHKGLRHPRIR